MMTFRQGLHELKLPLSSVWLPNDIAEAKGKQELYTRQSPQLRKALREMAMVQSVESSNRIEGVTVEPERLRPLVLGNTRPKITMPCFSRVRTIGTRARTTFCPG